MESGEHGTANQESGDLVEDVKNLPSLNGSGLLFPANFGFGRHICDGVDGKPLCVKSRFAPGMYALLATGIRFLQTKPRIQERTPVDRLYD